jgi:hypothetical protein
MSWWEEPPVSRLPASNSRRGPGIELGPVWISIPAAHHAFSTALQTTWETEGRYAQMNTGSLPRDMQVGGPVPRICWSQAQFNNGK